MSRQTRATTLQFAALLEFMRGHQDFAFGRLGGQDGRSESDRLWEEVTCILNAENGPQKSATKWQKTWIDWKCSTRSKAGKSRSDRRRTSAASDGSKWPSANLSPLEEQLLAFLEQQSPQECDYGSTLLPLPHNDTMRRDFECDDATAVYEVDGDEHMFQDGWENIEVKPHLVDNDVGSTSHETTMTTTKRCSRKRASAPDTEDDESNSCSKRLIAVLEGQQIQSAAVCRVATALEQMVSASSKRNDLEERRLAIQERKIAVCERKALLSERKIAVEERRVAAEEHLLHCVRTYLQDKKTGMLPYVANWNGQTGLQYLILQRRNRDLSKKIFPNRIS